MSDEDFPIDDEEFEYPSDLEDFGKFKYSGTAKKKIKYLKY